MLCPSPPSLGLVASSPLSTLRLNTPMRFSKKQVSLLAPPVPPGAVGIEVTSYNTVFFGQDVPWQIERKGRLLHCTG